MNTNKKKMMKRKLLFTGLLVAFSAITYAQEPTTSAATPVETHVMSKEELKQFNKQQKELEKANKEELKRQQTIAKTEKDIQKNTAKLAKLRNSYAKETKSLNAKLAKGKMTPVDELKTKGKLHKLNGQITNLEFELKTAQAKLESLKK